MTNIVIPHAESDLDSHCLFRLVNENTYGKYGTQRIRRIISRSTWSLARPAILVAGKDRRGIFLLLLFLHFHSCSSFSTVTLSSPQLSLLSLFSLYLGDDTKWPTRVDVSLNPNAFKHFANDQEHIFAWCSHIIGIVSVVLNTIKKVQVYASITYCHPHWLNEWMSMKKGKKIHLTGPSCSKLTMSLVNVSLKHWSLNMAYTLIFLLKNVSSFCICKSCSHFQQKYLWIRYCTY